MRVLLTGATGFIGIHLLERLLARGDEVRALVREKPGQARSPRVRQLLAQKGVEVIAGGLTDGTLLGEAARRVEVIYHLAWESNRPTKLQGRRNTHEELVRANLDGTERLLRAGVANRVRRFIYTSTVLVYGPHAAAAHYPIREEDTQRQRIAGRAQEDYIQPKIEAEQLIRRYSDRYGMESVMLRPSLVYGAGAQFADLWVRKALAGYWSRWGLEAEMTAQMVHVRDVVDALLLAESNVQATNQVFNIAGDEVATIAQIEAMIRGAAQRNALNLPPAAWFRGPASKLRDGDGLIFDLDKARAVLGFSPQVPLREGLEEMVAATLRDGQQGGAGKRADTWPGAWYDRNLSVDALGDYYNHSDFWNYGYWDADTADQEEACENLMEELLAYLPQKQGTILDVACGKGATTRHLLQYYPAEHVTGINISEKQLQRCRENAPGCTFLVMDATKLEFADNSFDNILCVEAACHFDTRRDFLREAHRVLKPGGRLVLSDAILPIDSQGQPRVNYVRSAEEYARECRDAGFCEVVVRDVTEACWGGFHDHLMAYAEERLRRGEMGVRGFQATKGFLWRIWTDLYVLACCRKEGVDSQI